MDAYIKKILSDNSIEKRIDNEGNVYRIRDLGRGNDLFFQENDNFLFCQINAIQGIIYVDSINKWDNHDNEMSKDERNRVIDLVYLYYKLIYNPDVILK